MKRVSYIFICVCAFLMGMCAHVYAQAPGADCSTAIPMGKDYRADVKKGQSIWYSAWTFDLPLTVTFAPKGGSADPAPIVKMDFTCTPGIYEDTILCSLFCPTSSGSGIQFDMPHTPELKSKTLNGTFVYYLSLGKRYRDLLLQMGIGYNLEVYVEVTYQSDGVISMAPDDLFSNCVDNAQFMRYGDTVKVAANDKKKHVIVPYVQWQEDTVIYKWNGTSPCTLSVVNTCDFDPTDNSDDNIIQYEPNIQPGDSVKVEATWIYKWVNNPDYHSEAGMYFATVYSTAPGELIVKKAPQSPPRGKATILRFDRTYALNANETNLFAITRMWDDDTLHTKFETPTEHVFRMQIANDPDFAEEHILAKYQFDKSANGHSLGIYGSDMVALWKKATEQYLYIRFICSEATTVTPSRWTVSKCIVDTKNYINSLDTSFAVKRGSTGGNYKLNYSMLVGGDLKMTFTPAKKCSVFVATDCNISLSATASNLLYHTVLTTSSSSTTITEDVIAGWADRVDDDGYIYMRLHHTESIGTYKMKLQSTAPADTDPVYPTATITVACDDANKPYVEVNKAQTLTIQDEAGMMVKTIPAEPNTKYPLSELSTGKYTIQGESETITINL